MNITEDVIGDLWPLYADGTASADSRRSSRNIYATIRSGRANCATPPMPRRGPQPGQSRPTVRCKC